MADMIDRAASNPDATYVLNGRSADVNRLFGSEEGLMLSLRHRWMTMLTAKLDQAVHEDIPAVQARADLVAAHPGLRALLDAAALRSVRVRALEHGEKHILNLYAGPDGDRQTVA